VYCSRTVKISPTRTLRRKSHLSSNGNKFPCGSHPKATIRTVRLRPIVRSFRFLYLLPPCSPFFHITLAFRTDTDISASSNGRAPQRELHAWKPETSSPTASGAPPQFGKEGGGDDVTFGSTAQNGSWDQFSANEQLFGVTATFDEDIYTTKLDRSAPDFKERERKAARIASEIMGVWFLISFVQSLDTYVLSRPLRTIPIKRKNVVTLTIAE
jgi:hypothetical protein